MAAGIPGGYSRYKVVVLPIYHAGRYTRYNAIILRSACDAADQGGKLTVIDVSKRFCYFWHDARLDSRLDLPPEPLTDECPACYGLHP